MYFTLMSFLLCFDYISGANILAIFQFPSNSHQFVFQPLWRELSLRGHKVTVVAPKILNDSSLTNLTEVSVKEVFEVVEEHKLHKVGSKDGNLVNTLTSSERLLNAVTDRVLNNTEFQKLINDKNKKFDLILSECSFNVMHLLAEKYKVPIITVSSLAVLAGHYTLIGSPNHPRLYRDMIMNSIILDLSYWHKVRNVIVGIWAVYYHLHHLVPNTHKMAQKYFNDNIPYVRNLEKNFRMIYLNENPLLYPVRPHVPSVIQIGQMQFKPAKLLPIDLQEILDEAKEGVIYFSLGSNIKSVDIEESLRNIITQAFSELPYKVIFKWETDFLPNKPPNVIIRKWLPQQDLLAHPNIRVFVTQGGIQSIEEAIDKEVPMVGLPFNYDQPVNMQKVFELGVGISLDVLTVTKDDLRNSIIEVAENSFYKKQIKKARSLQLDKRINATENAIWWLEYMIRHRGAKHLRSPSADFSWFDYLMLDVLCVFIIFVTLIIYGSCKVIKIINTFLL